MSTNEHHMDWPPSEPKIVKDELIQTTVKGSSFSRNWLLLQLYLVFLV